MVKITAPPAAAGANVSNKAGDNSTDHGNRAGNRMHKEGDTDSGTHKAGNEDNDSGDSSWGAIVPLGHTTRVQVRMRPGLPSR
jgi:hypothetical protein